MTKQILFVILDQYADWEGAYLSSAIYMLGDGKYSVKTVSLNKEPVQSIGGFRALPDYDIDSVPDDYEALILVGGLAWRTEEAKEIERLVRKAQADKKIIGGICDASAFLGTIGVLNEVQHTSNDLDNLKQWAGDAYTGEDHYLLQQAVRDRNVVTANGTAALEFGREVLLALNAAPVNKIMEWYHFHKLGYYDAPLPEAVKL